ncbi:DUF4249 domain-containing protein [uncultured Bacteroides sp.]|uniref:DUF4249 domain-containing protein n=1 Tax=uncultured Bacteroides sp. TaxID=162156 RepID=UPI002AAC24A3|nr:DUF4249 domain-containing protein [uncultured Bacteroides sp.]
MLHNRYFSGMSKCYNYFSYVLRLFSVCLLLMFASCTEIIDINTDNSKPVIVIYGAITDIPSFQEVSISSSTGYFDNKTNPKISGAKVTITSGSEEYTLNEVEGTPGLYRTTTKMSGIPGKTYNLQVEVDYNGDGVNEVYEASAKMEEKVQLDSIDVTSQLVSQRNYFSVNMYAQDPSSEDYYMCRYQINDSVYNKISKYIVFDDTSVNGQYIKGLSLGYFPDIKDKSKYSDDEVKEMTFMAEGDSVKFQLSRITKGYYRFLFQCQQEKNGEDPFFGGPLSNIDTNISNGGTGYFAAFAVSEAKGVAPKQDISNEK